MGPGSRSGSGAIGAPERGNARNGLTARAVRDSSCGEPTGAARHGLPARRRHASDRWITWTWPAHGSPTPRPSVVHEVVGPLPSTVEPPGPLLRASPGFEALLGPGGGGRAERSGDVESLPR